MGYGDLSHTEVIVSHEKKFRLLYKYLFYSLETQLQPNENVKELSHGIWEFYLSANQNTTNFFKIE